MAESYVGKPCPKCRHVRSAGEAAPDWQCPKCGVAYAKFLQTQSAPPAAVGQATATKTALAGARPPATGGGSTGLAMFTHLSILIGFIIPFFGLIVPIVVWITKKDSDELAVANAKEAINFQISLLLWSLLLLGLAFLGPMVWVAAALALVLGIGFLVLPIVAAVKANGGDQFRYP